jgi:DNA-binding LytR/AlgR family response regulator
VNDKDRRQAPSYNRPMKALLAFLSFWLLTAAAPPILNGPARVCDGPGARHCRPVALIDLRLRGPETHVERTITVSPDALPLSRPLTVWITAMASAEVRWNGVLIGRNGVPGPDRASEVPGRFIAHVAVPAELVRPGANVVSLRLSAHHLFLPVQRTVHVFAVSPYETPLLPGLTDYIPAMLTLGALLAALAYFGASAFSDRGERQARLVASIAALAAVQLLIEISRAFIAYPYPWHLMRVAAIALLAGATALTASLYAVRRFAAAWEYRIMVPAGIAVTLSLLLIPWYDIKAMAAILAGAMAIAAAGLRGWRRRRPGARAALAGAGLIVALMARQVTVFLDQAYYLIVAGLLVALVAEQVSILRNARRRHDSEKARNAALEERLARASETGEPIVQLKDGSRLHRVPESDILYVKAADDYCDVALIDGRTLLVTTTLARLLERLPGTFLRVHKSYAVNRRHVAGVAPRPGGGRQLTLAPGGSVPVGRRYGEAIAPLRRG